MPIFRKAEQSWKTIAVGELFSLQIPQQFATRIADDVLNTLEIRLEGGEVLVGWFPLKEEDRRPNPQWFVRQMVEEFFEGSVAGTLGGRREWQGWDASRAAVADYKGLMLLQTPKLFRPARWWYARVLRFESSDVWFLLHWNGPEAELYDRVIAIIESFELGVEPAPECEG